MSFFFWGRLCVVFKQALPMLTPTAVFWSERKVLGVFLDSFEQQRATYRFLLGNVHQLMRWSVDCRVIGPHRIGPLCNLLLLELVEIMPLRLLPWGRSSSTVMAVLDRAGEDATKLSWSDMECHWWFWEFLIPKSMLGSPSSLSFFYDFGQKVGMWWI